MADTKITNATSASITLPPPFRGVLGPGRSVVVNSPLATVKIDLGPSGDPSTGLLLEEVQDQTTSSYWFPYP